MGNLKIGKTLVTWRRHKLITDVMGIRSTCKNLHVLFLDFDCMSYALVRDTCKQLQKRFGLSDFYIIESSENHYHAVCLDLLSFGTVCDIQFALDMRKYISFSAYRGYWVLRFTSKGKKEAPFFKGFVLAKNKKLKSNPHRLWLGKWFGVEIPKSKFFVGGTKIIIDKYTTEEKKDG